MSTCEDFLPSGAFCVQCKVVNASLSRCSQCVNGHTGEYCELLKKPLAGVYAFDAVLYAVVFVFWVVMAVRRYRRTQGSDFDEAVLKGAQASRQFSRLGRFGGRTFLFLYRFVIFFFVLPVHLYSVSTALPGYGANYRFYTVWNFILVAVYFGLGLGLSAFTLVRGSVSAISSNAFMRFNAKLHFILLEIELPNTLIVDVLTWAILFPAPNGSSLLSFASIVQHIANFFFMSVDFALCRHAFNPQLWMFNLALPTTYAIFHICYTAANDYAGHQPVYFFLDASTWAQAAWITGVLLIHVAIFFLVWAFTTFALGRRLNSVFYDDGEQETALAAPKTAPGDQPENKA